MTFGHLIIIDRQLLANTKDQLKLKFGRILIEWKSAKGGFSMGTGKYEVVSSFHSHLVHRSYELQPILIN